VQSTEIFIKNVLLQKMFLACVFAFLRGKKPCQKPSFLCSAPSCYLCDAFCEMFRCSAPYFSASHIELSIFRCSAPFFLTVILGLFIFRSSAVWRCRVFVIFRNYLIHKLRYRVQKYLIHI